MVGRILKRTFVFNILFLGLVYHTPLPGTQKKSDVSLTFFNSPDVSNLEVISNKLLVYRHCIASISILILVGWSPKFHLGIRDSNEQSGCLHGNVGGPVSNLLRSYGRSYQ